MKYTEFIAEVKTIAEAAGKTEVVEFAEKELAKYEKAQVTRKAYADKKTAEKRAAKAEVAEKIFAALTDEPQTATDLIAATGVEITPQGVAALVRVFGEGRVAKTEIKLAGVKGKKVGYVKACPTL